MQFYVHSLAVDAYVRTRIPVALLLINCLGGWAVFGRLRKSIMVYAGTMFLLMAAALAVIGFYAQYVKVVQDVGAGGLVAPTAEQAGFSDYVLSMYTACCQLDDALCPTINPNAGWQLYCPPVQFCADANGTTLYCYQGTYTNPSDPPVAIGSEICGALRAGGLVGADRTTLFQCGADPDPTLNGAPKFFAEFYSFIAGLLSLPYYGFGAVAGLCFVVDVMCAFLLYHWSHVDSAEFSGRRVNAKRVQEDEEFEEQMNTSVRASMHDWYNEDESSDVPAATSVASTSYKSPPVARASMVEEDLEAPVAARTPVPTRGGGDSSRLQRDVRSFFHACRARETGLTHRRSTR